MANGKWLFNSIQILTHHFALESVLESSPFSVLISLLNRRISTGFGFIEAYLLCTIHNPHRVHTMHYTFWITVCAYFHIIILWYTIWTDEKFSKNWLLFFFLFVWFMEIFHFRVQQIKTLQNDEVSLLFTIQKPNIGMQSNVCETCDVQDSRCLMVDRKRSVLNWTNDYVFFFFFP